MHIFNKDLRSEDGNVLFLILIAVALFAALSYAVTQSSRSGGGGADDSSALVQSSQVTQYPASVKTSALRLQVSKGISPDNLAFNTPSHYGSLTRNEIGVFHPDGGAATYQPKVSFGGNQVGPWRFVDLNIQNIGRANKDEIVAALAEVPDNVCDSINEELGLTTVTPDSGNANVETSATVPSNSSFDTLNDNIADANGTNDLEASERSPLFTSGTNGIGDSSCNPGTCDTPELRGQAFGCLEDGNEVNVYFHAIVER